jgi:hypothetical protein
MVEYLLNDELDMMWQEAFVAEFKILSPHFLEGSRKMLAKPGIIAIFEPWTAKYEAKILLCQSRRSMYMKVGL